MKQNHFGFGLSKKSQPALFFAAILTLFIIISCNSKDDDKKTGDNENKENKADTTKRKLNIYDTIIGGVKKKIIDATSTTGIKLEVLDYEVLGVLPEIRTHFFKLSADNARALFSSGDGSKQLGFYFDLHTDGTYDIRVSGWNGSGSPITASQLLERIGDTTLREADIYPTRFVRGRVREKFDPYSEAGPIAAFQDLYFTPIVNKGKKVLLMMTLTNPTTPASKAEIGFPSNPIPPSDPSCDPHCDL